MNGGIYEIRNKVTGKYYVGRTQDFKTRFNRHRYELRHGRHHCLHLQRAWKKYGEDQFEFLIVCGCGLETAIQLEQARLNASDPLMYNIGKSSTGGDLISGHPERERIIKRMSQSLVIRYAGMSREERVRTFGRSGVRNGMFGKQHSLQSRQQMSDTALRNTKRGEEHHNFGIKRSAETRQKMSEIASARTGCANPFFGKQHSEQTKAAISARKRGTLPTNLRAVLVEDMEYPSVTEAARKLSVSPPLVIYRIKSPKYDYHYRDDF